MCPTCCAICSSDTNDGLPAIPEAQDAAMVLAGLGPVATNMRRRRA